ncbi:fluoride efflux transporter CrcB [[Mycobacterium] nativiensis]|uniref:Fluoride-specific ion channel FluC n=1 Tax=[Mycobacterium] nativiensis TaxID=2855503 RepID=A0ABU5Y1K9_9MYCO|nr:fluoride efflux transporter CrcB [Mycolicibacter sp. MYC340]MEB3034124.1 fluoride efflux transporter CrcB [Mycolicibacter sp. MYC340]
MSPLVWVCVGLAGGVGAVLRFVVDRAVARRVASAFPAGTLVVNLSGAAVLGLMSGLVLPAEVTLLAGTALIGSYTTFSTWMLETHRLAEERQFRTAAANIVAGIVLGLAATELGRWVAGSL